MWSESSCRSNSSRGGSSGSSPHSSYRGSCTCGVKVDVGVIVVEVVVVHVE